MLDRGYMDMEKEWIEKIHSESTIMYKFYITGTRRGLGQALKEKFGCVDTIEECDVFINNKHETQMAMLNHAAPLDKKIINIGSHASYYPKRNDYAREKFLLKNRHDVLFDEGVDTCIINFGYFDTPRVAHITDDKMSVPYCVGVIEWILKQPYSVRELTVC